MSSELIRVLVALAFAAVLWRLARGSGGRPHQRRAYELASGAMLAVAAFNGGVAAGGGFGLLQQVTAAAAVALLIGSVVQLFLAWRGGEQRGAVEDTVRLAEAFRRDRERRQAGPDENP